MRSLPLRVFFVLLVAAIIALPASAQDDPNRDNNPPDPFGPPTGPRFPLPELTVITTPDGFDNFDLGVNNAEPHMSNSPVNPRWYFNAYNTNDPYYTIDGHNWSFNRPSFPNAAGDPVTCYDSLGNLYYQTMKSPITGTWVVKSTDGGRTFGTAISSANGNDKNWMCADQSAGPYSNFLYSTMTNSSAGGAQFARSTDFGATWQQITVLTPHGLPGAMPAVGPNKGPGFDIPGGCVYAVTHSGTNAAGVYTFFRSTDGGLTFSQRSQGQFSNVIGTEISGRSTVQFMRCRPYPFITVDNSYGAFRGRVYLVYASNNPAGSGNKSDIFIRHSDDQCSTWTAPRVVNDDPNSQNNFQFHPAVWCEKSSGRLYVKFYDTRRVPTSDSMDVYGTYSDDGGITFAPNQRITNRTFKINFRNYTSGANYQGDYDAITSNPVTSLSVWTDFRNTNYGSYVGYFPDFAMLASPAADTLRNVDSAIVRVKVPAVKLWSNRVRFSATVSPAADFSFLWPRGDSLRTFPDSVDLKIRANGVPDGLYTVTIQGEGPNGTPVHRRTVAVRVMYIPNTVALSQPLGGEIWFAGTNRQIAWARTGDVDTVRIEYSTNNGSTWSLVSSRYPSDSVYRWTIPNTPTTQAKVRVSWLDSSAVSAQSGLFRISTPSPLVTLNRDSIVAAMEVGPNTARDTLRIGNTGVLALNWTLADTMAWFTAAPASGTTPVDSVRTSVLTFTGTGLAAGTYRGTLTLTSNDTVNGTKRIPVRLTVFTRAAIEVSSTSLAYGSVFVGDTLARTVTIRNRGTGNLVLSTVTIPQEPEYASPASGTQVVPPVITSATATGRYTLQASGTQLAYNIRVQGLSGAITAAYLRSGPRGANGGVARTLVFTGDSAVGVWPNVGLEAFTVARRESLKAGLLYLEIRTAANPNGEVRGQIDGAFFTDLVPATIAPGDSLVRRVRFAPVAPATYTGVLSILSNDPDPADDTVFVSLAGTGLARPTGVAEERGGIPTAYELDQNFPNPFNPTTRIDFAVPEDAFVTLRVFNLLGQEVAVLVNGEKAAGYHSAVWDARKAGASVSSGMYFYRFEAKGVSGKPYSAIRKMLLVK